MDNYYEFFIGTTGGGTTPWQRYHDRLQELVSKQFENASTYLEEGIVEEEIGFGTLEFKPIACRMVSLVDTKTGQRINEDFKHIIYEDLTYEPSIGLRYRFKNSIWILDNSNNMFSISAGAYLRRCNNTINSQDVYGNIHREPCYIGYKIVENQLFRNYTMEVPSGKLEVVCQNNNYTDHYDINDRFIFGRHAYKLRSLGKFDRRETFEEDSNRIITFYVDEDAISSSDDLENGIADNRNFEYHISSVDAIKNTVGYSGILDFTIYRNDQIISEPVIITSSNNSIAKIDNSGNFEFVGLGDCIFTITMSNNTSVFENINITVENSVISDIYTKVDPDSKSVTINSTKVFYIYEYDNGVQLDTQFNIRVSSNNIVASRYYDFKIIGAANASNSFSVKCLKSSDYNLIVECVSRRDGKKTEVEIELGGI